MATTQQILIKQGVSHTEIVTVQVLTNNALPFNSSTNPYIPLDFTGYSALLQVRKDYDAPTPVINLTNLNSGISFASGGKLTINVSASVSNTVVFAGAKWEGLYDLTLTNGSTVLNPITGNFVIQRNIARA